MFLFIPIGCCATIQSNWICIRWIDRQFVIRHFRIDDQIKKKSITLNIYTLQLPDNLNLKISICSKAFIHHEVSMGNVWFLLCICLPFCCFMLLLVWHFDSVFICRAVVWSAVVKVFFYLFVWSRIAFVFLLPYLDCLCVFHV